MSIDTLNKGTGEKDPSAVLPRPDELSGLANSQSSSVVIARPKAVAISTHKACLFEIAASLTSFAPRNDGLFDRFLKNAASRLFNTAKTISLIILCFAFLMPTSAHSKDNSFYKTVGGRQVKFVPRDYMQRYKKSDVLLEIPDNFYEEGYIIKGINGTPVNYLYDRNFGTADYYKSKSIYLPSGKNTIIMDHLFTKWDADDVRSKKMIKISFEARPGYTYALKAKSDYSVKKWGVIIGIKTRSRKLLKPHKFERELVTRGKGRELSKTPLKECFVMVPEKRKKAAVKSKATATKKDRKKNPKAAG